MVGEFVLRERIDEGGFGAVYRCDQPLLGREAVVKVLHQKLRRNDVVLQRFMREAQLASRLDHPYAAHVYAFGIEHDDGLFWIAMEMVQGTTLNRWLRERGPLSLDQFVPFFERVAEVVHTAHDRGIVHRDLKPSNVMVVERAGRLLPKLLDFGIAKLLDEAAANLPGSPDLPHPSDDTQDGYPDGSDPGARAVNLSEVPTLTGTTTPPPRRGLPHRLTHADATVGSPPYMSPEQWSNAITVGPSADLYALGVVAYEALTGRRPFHANSLPEYVDLHCHAPVPPLGDGFSPALDRMFQRALAKQPEDRWGSALELAAALRVASGLGTTAADLPKLDDTVREAWLADAPQPLAESIAALDGARNAHQARGAAHELLGNLLRYLLALGLATYAQVRGERGDPELLELVRTMRQRDLRDEERVRLLRALVRPLTSWRGAHPIPELVDLVTPRSDDGADGLDALLALCATTDHFTTEDIVQARLARLVPELGHVLRKMRFVLDYVLIVPHGNAAERWTGLRRQHRALATVRTAELVEHHPMLLDRDARVCVDLWPLMQAVAPSEGAELEPFLFDGRGRHGARMIAAPSGFEHHDPGVWDWLAACVLAESEAGPDVGEADQPPYLGLTPFSTEDAARFVGREGEVEALLNRLRQRALQVVVGPSGAGKSSFVHAGVIPGLPAGWRAVTMRPGAAPLAALASRLVAAQVTTTDLRPVLQASPPAAAALVAHAAASGTIVLVVDQLEELFTLCPSADERLQFAAVLAQLAASADAPIRVICTIRDDFLMQLDALAPLRSVLSPAVYLLGNPSHEALVRIVVEPARLAGYALSDPELAHDMVNTVAERPGALALLSFTASRLWELRDRRFRQLTRNAYNAMGGVGGALGQHAEATLDGCSGDEQRVVRAIFRQLVTSDGARARLSKRELRQRLASPHADTVVDKLVAARLLSAAEYDGEPHIEIVHEALIAAWPRLQRWVREDLDSTRLREQICASARQWDDRGRPRGLLWRDDVLSELERWLRRSPLELSELESAFVAASRGGARRASRIRRMLGVVALALVGSFVGFQYRALQSDVARQLAEARVTQSYVEQGRQTHIGGDVTMALPYLAEALRRGDDSESTRFMLGIDVQPFLAERARLKSTAGRMWTATFSPDGRRIVTTDDKTARVWDAATYKLLFTLPHDGPVFDVGFSPDGARLVTASDDGYVKVWDFTAGTLLHSLTQKLSSGASPRYYCAAISPDGKTVVGIDGSGEVAHVWNASGEFITQLPGSSAWYPSLAFSADGRWLATSSGNDARVFDAHTWKVVLNIPGPRIRSIAFDPSGPRFATGSGRGDVSIWSVPDGQRIQHLNEIGARIDHVVYSGDGELLLTTSRDGAVRIWRSNTGELQTELKNHDIGGVMAAFDSTSKLVVSAGSPGVVVVSDVASGVPIATFGGFGAVATAAKFDPTSHRVVGASWDGTARVWDVTSTYHQWSSPSIGDDCGADVVPQPDQRFLTVNCTQHGVYVWDTASGNRLAELPAPTQPPVDFWPTPPAVSAEGDRAAIVMGKGVVVYELPGGRVVRTIPHAAPVTAVAFAQSGHDIVSGSSDGALFVTRDGREPIPLREFPGGVDAVGFTPDGRVIAAGHLLIRKYDPDLATVISTLSAPTRIRAFRVSADARRLLTIPVPDQPEPPVLWDLENGRMIARLEGHTGLVYSARFVRGDRDILTGGADGIAQLWDGTTGALRQAFIGSSRSLFDAVMDPEGTMVITAPSDGILRFWEASSGRMLWTLRAHRWRIAGLHFEGADLVTRAYAGELSRWRLPKVPALPELRRQIGPVVRCLPFRFDEQTGRLVPQRECDGSSVGN